MADDPTSVRVTCAFEGSAEELFDAWLDPATARRWLFATPAGESTRAEIDPRVGGAFLLAERRGGREVEHAGRYLVIERPARLAFELRATPGSEEASRVGVAITPAGGWLILSLTQEGVPPELAAPTQEGWSRSLDRLATILERRRAGGAGEPPVAVA